MQIDWFTLIAQTINFLVLLWLLKRFLFNRIVRAMQERKEKVAAEFDKADEKKREAEKEREKYRSELDKIDDKREEILEEAREEADRIRKEAREKARREAERMRSEWLGSLEAEKEDFKRTLRRKSGREVLALTRDALRNLAGADLQDRVIDAFVARLDDMSGVEKDKLRGQGDSGKPKVRVRSSFELSDDQSAGVEKALAGALDTKDLDFEIETDEKLVIGLQVDIEGQRLGWSVADLIDDMEEMFEREIDRVTKRAARKKEEREGKEQEEQEKENEGESEDKKAS